MGIAEKYEQLKAENVVALSEDAAGSAVVLTHTVYDSDTGKEAGFEKHVIDVEALQVRLQSLADEIKSINALLTDIAARKGKE